MQPTSQLNQPLDQQPDQLEKCLRLLCGALLGGLCGGYVWLRHLPTVPISIGGILILASMGISAYGALKYGDYFWTSLIRHFSRFL